MAGFELRPGKGTKIPSARSTSVLSRYLGYQKRLFRCCGDIVKRGDNICILNLCLYKLGKISHMSPALNIHALFLYIVGSRGASQLGGSLLGIPPGYLH